MFGKNAIRSSARRHKRENDLGSHRTSLKDPIMVLVAALLFLVSENIIMLFMNVYCELFIAY